MISDTHCGCQVGLCPPKGVRVDDGGLYAVSRLQRKLWALWEAFWEWVPEATRGEPYIVVHNGDVIDGRHHRSITQITQNLTIQTRIAEEVLAPRVDGRPFFMVRGTEAHTGPSAENEEDLAERLGAIPDEDGRFARWELWKRIGPRLVHFSHHIGVTGSQHYESTSVHKELIEAFTEAARNSLQPPSVIVRSHRHRYIETRIPTDKGDAISTVTPGWQLKTPFAFRTPGGRQTQPQIGGLVVRLADGELFVRSKVWSLARSKAV